MYSLDDVKYEETLKILREGIKLEPIYLEFKNWLKDRFGIIAYNFILSKIKDENLEICILLASRLDYMSMLKSNKYEFNKKKQDEIQKNFCFLVEKYKLANEYNYNDIYIDYKDFSSVIKENINNKVLSNKKEYFESKYLHYSLCCIYAIGASVAVFYHKDIDVKINTKNGISETIKKEYFIAIKEVDEFNVFSFDKFIMTFDSKENLDKNYNGNIYAYGYK